MKVLIACEESQTVCKAFRALGHEAYSCDIVDCSGGHPEWHLQQDVLPLLKMKWDLIIAHPPCTYMSKAGARWMYPKAGQLSEERYRMSQEARAFFMKFYNLDCEHIAIENPVPLKVVNLPPQHRKSNLTNTANHTARQHCSGSKDCQNYILPKFYQNIHLGCHQTLADILVAKEEVVASPTTKGLHQRRLTALQRLWQNNGRNI